MRAADTRRFVQLAMLFVFLLLAGCQNRLPATYSVEGRVIFADGRPITDAVVEFQSIPTHGQRVNARAVTDQTGHFQLTSFRTGDGALAGEHRVVVRAPPTLGNVERGDPPKHIVHPRFENYDTSALTFTVRKQANFFTIIIDPP